MPLNTEGTRYRSADLTLTFGPGVVRDLDPLSLVADAGRFVIEEIASFGVVPSIRFPTNDSIAHDLGIKNERFWNARFKFSDFPSLFEPRPHDEIIREIALIFKSYSEAPFPTEAYLAFSQYTESSGLVLSEFLESWMRETFNNYDLAESYAESDDHLLLNGVFRKTDYILTRRKEIEAVAEEIMQIEEEVRAEEAALRFDDSLRRSSFEIFTYLMEDTRNGMIKIGKSKNPARREKTLQSEAPTVEMRIAVPTESEFESELHEEFDHLRRRGEWFELSSLEIKTLIERLLTHGDPDRAITSHEWIGRIFLTAYSNECRSLVNTNE